MRDGNSELNRHDAKDAKAKELVPHLLLASPGMIVFDLHAFYGCVTGNSEELNRHDAKDAKAKELVPHAYGPPY